MRDSLIASPSTKGEDPLLCFGRGSNSGARMSGESLLGWNTLTDFLSWSTMDKGRQKGSTWKQQSRFLKYSVNIWLIESPHVMRKSIFLISHRATFSLILPSPWNHGTSPGYNRSWVLMVQQSMTSLNSQAAIADYKGKQSLVLGKGPGFLVLSPRDQMETSYVYCFAVLQCFGEVVLFISFRLYI